MRIVIVGAGGTGCIAALLLARAGHEVIVLERDTLPLSAPGVVPPLVQPTRDQLETALGMR